MATIRTPQTAVCAMFALNGALVGLWASRIPAFVARFDISQGTLGLLMLAIAIGALAAFPLTGSLSDRLGAARLTRMIAALTGLSVIGMALAPSLPALVIMLVLFGATQGGMDVAMNAWGTEVERTLPRPYMPVFHAMWSLGAGLGAGTGFLAVQAGIGVSAHFITMAILLTALAQYLASCPWDSEVTAGQGGGLALPKGPLIAVGVITLCSSVGEGAMVDWSAVYLDTMTDASTAQAALGYAVFSVTMVAVRILGAPYLGRVGAARVTRLSGAVALAGIVLTVAADSLWMALPGFALMAMGYAFVFPMAMTRAAQQPGIGTGRAIASVATLGYGAILMGPPLLGFLAEASSLRISFALLGALCLVIVALAGRMAPPR